MDFGPPPRRIPAPSTPGVCPDPIPAAMRETARWVVWRLTHRDGDKPTKVPFRADGRGAASSTDPETWCDYASARAAVATGRYTGVGFVLGDGWAGVDLDDCLDDAGNFTWGSLIIEKFHDTYAEISPSGHGVKIFGRGAKPPAVRKSKVNGQGPDKRGKIEIYDAGRYFTVTGRALPGHPADVADFTAPLTDLCREYLMPPPAPARSTPPPRRAAKSILDRARDYVAKMPASISGAGGHDAAIAVACVLRKFDLTDGEMLTVFQEFNSRCDPPWNDREIQHKLDDGKKLVDAAGERGSLLASRGSSSQKTPTIIIPGSENADPRPRILIDTEEHRVIAETIQALTVDKTIYRRGDFLARVRTDEQPVDGIMRAAGSPTIQRLPAPSLRERITAHILFTKMTREGNITSAHPTGWLVSAVDARGDWPGIRPLLGVSDAPILRADGSIWQEPGYDDRTGVIFEPSPGASFPKIDPDVTQDDADAAMQRLLEPFADFPFEEPIHQSAALSALLTPLARYAFTGPSPLFLVDSNIRGAGKGLLCQVVGRIALGREMPVSSYSHDPVEMRKRITACAIAGDQAILLDNLSGNFGNEAIDSALTSTRWKDRILGRSEEVELPLLAVWYATGNNVAVAADTARRIIHIRLDAMTDKPEERTGFVHRDLITWTRQNRGMLLSDALTILAAYIHVGRPTHNLTPFGSFEGWSSLVREAIVWLGLPDPCLTRSRLAESADTTSEALTQVIQAWRELNRNLPVVVSKMLAELYPADRQYAPNSADAISMRSALENLANCPPGKMPTARHVGIKLRQFRRRVIAGNYLDVVGTVRGGSVAWKLFSTSETTTAGLGTP